MALKQPLQLTPQLYDYLLSNSLRDDEVLKALRTETASLPLGVMQIAPEQGQLLNLLVKLTGARRCIEVGVFTGYSALCIARALPTDGMLLACDISEEWTSVARRYWQQAGVAERVNLQLAPAIETLDTAIANGEADSYDFAFIDADKTNYQNYYERCLTLLRPGGLIVIDNVLWGGSVADISKQDDDTRALRAIATRIHGDGRVDSSMIPVADGLLLCRKH